MITPAPRDKSPRQNADSEETGLFTSRDMNFYLNDLDDMKTYPVYFMGESVNALKQRGVPGRGLPPRTDHPTKNHIIFKKEKTL